MFILERRKLSLRKVTQLALDHPVSKWNYYTWIPQVGCQNLSFYLLPSVALPFNFQKDLTCCVAAEASWEMTHVHRYMCACTPYTHGLCKAQSNAKLRMWYCFYVHLKSTCNTFVVSLSCYNKAPQTGWLINNRSLFLTVLEAGNWRSRYQHSQVLGSTLFQAVGFLFCTHTAEKTCSLITLRRALNLLVRTLPSWPHLILTTSQRPHLLTPPHWGVAFQHMNLVVGEDVNIQSVRQRW